MGFSITPAHSRDYEAFARLFPELDVIESTPSAEHFVSAIVPGALFLRDDGEVAGYAWWRARGQRAHVVHLIVDPAHRRKGVGRALMNAVAQRGRVAGLEKWMLNVKPENVAARALYESCGMRVVFESASMRFEWANLEKLEATEGALARLLERGEEEKFEVAFSLPPGEISNFRAFPGRILFACEDARGPAGVGAFDPNFPGASPFAVRDPRFARVLFERMRAHALPEHDHLFVFAENNPSLVAALTNAGSQTAMRVLRMEGTIP